MKYLRQFLLILFISFLGELLKYFLPLPIPASIYGMVILFIGLLSGIIKLDAVKDVGKFLIEIMPVMFIPAGVGLMASWGTLKPVLVPVSVITVVALVAVMGATGRVSQCVIKKSKAKEKAKEQEIQRSCTEPYITEIHMQKVREPIQSKMVRSRSPMDSTHLHVIGNQARLHGM